MPWVLRGLRDGIVTTRWPRRRDGYFEEWAGVVEPRPDPQRVGPGEVEQVAGVCPTGAIGQVDGGMNVDQGACIGCGRCILEKRSLESVSLESGMFTWRRGSDLARLRRDALVVPAVEESDASLQRLRSSLAERTRAFGRSVHLRHVDAGSDGAEEWEIAALLNPVYDIHRLGVFLTASPRHADILLVTGIGATGMIAPLRRTLEAMPNPVVVVAVGTDACSGGMLKSSYAGSGGVGDLVDVDVWVPGSPPPPFAILHGLLLALGRLPERVAGGRP